MNVVGVNSSKVAFSGVLALCLVACSPEPASAPGAAQSTGSEASSTIPAPESLPAAPIPYTADGPDAPNVLTLEGIDRLKIGKPVPADGRWKQRGAQIPGSCGTVSSPDFPGVYAIVEDGEVRRITVGGQSTVKLIEGIGVGASEAEVRGAFPGFREEPHKYVERPAKYLNAPKPPVDAPGLRFEIDREGKVSLVHVGIEPVLSYVEGCS